MKAAFTILFFLICDACFSQHRGDYWVFGDSMAVNFTAVPPSIDTTVYMCSLEASASIADENGNLLFYGGSPSIYGNNFFKLNIWNSDRQLMQNGDSLSGNSSITQGILIIPFPGDTLQYYIFHIGYSPRSLYYSIVDLSFNSGLGKVTSKNNFLAGSISEKMQAVKHGNGRDWWLIVHGLNTDQYVKYLIDASGIHGPYSQATGSDFSIGSGGFFGQMKISRSGKKLLNVSQSGIIDLFDFDRCTGNISNWIQISAPSISANPIYYGCSFSPHEKFLYVSTSAHPSPDSLWQLDLSAGNIAGSRQLLFSTSNATAQLGQHLLAPDNKIYITSVYGTVLINQSYDSTNMNLSVIHDPDSNGTSSNYAPYSFYLGGRRCFWGLPNIPDYNLEAMDSSLCDTIDASTELITPDGSVNFTIYPNPNRGIFTISCLLPDNRPCYISICDMSGRQLKVMKPEKVPGNSGVDLTSFANGTYLCKLYSDGNLKKCRILTISK